MKVKSEIEQQAIETKKPSANIELKSFIVVVLLLAFMLTLSGVLSYIIPNGSFERDADGFIIQGTYTVHEEQGGIAVWRVITAPFRVFASEDALTIIMISVFLLVMSGIFNLLEKTGGTKIVIGRLMNKLADRGAPVVCFCVLIFMLFGSFFGMFEELVTLLPIMILFMLSMGMDTMMGLGTCLLAACFGFSAAITNPFSVGLASQYMGLSPADGVWLRLVFFLLIYATVCAFLLLYLRKLRKDPKLSVSYAEDLEKRNKLEQPNQIHGEEEQRIFRIYCGFFAVQGLVLLAIASVRAISGLAIPILAASFLWLIAIWNYIMALIKKDGID